MITIKRGSKGEEVKILQQKLNLMQDGIFGPLTEEAVKEFQRLNGLAVDGVVGTKTWGALNVLSLPKRNVDLLIVHCTATPEGQEYSNDTIRKWHLARGFNDIGYHYVIGLNGDIRKGRDESVVGAHTKGYNSRSIGICYVGGLDKDGKIKDTRTPAQKASLLKLLRELKVRYPKAAIHGHREYAAKACPCFDARGEYKNI